MFQIARLKLTAWYLLIIMSISILFSVIIYQSTIDEVQRSLRSQILREYREQYGGDPFTFQPPPLQDIIIDPQVLLETEDRIKLNLLLINLGIIIISGAAGYFLAGRTLNPIKQMVEEQNRFITDASHELRTPITALKSEIEVYLRNKTHTLPESNELLKSNLEEVNSLQLLSDNLLALTQYQRSYDKKSFEPLSLTEIIAIAEKKITSIAKRKHMFFANTISDTTLIGDKQSLVQLFVILFENAVKYGKTKTAIQITAHVIKQHALIAITDQGIGIDEKDISHIFERFFRADSSRSKTTVPGYGLGLSIAKKIVTTHHGSISVRSIVNKGTTFTVRLPII